MYVNSSCLATIIEGLLQILKELTRGYSKKCNLGHSKLGLNICNSYTIFAILKLYMHLYV